MKALKERILRDGKCFEGGILKVDNFINHQMDPILMKSMAVEFVRRFARTDINHHALFVRIILIGFVFCHNNLNFVQS